MKKLIDKMWAYFFFEIMGVVFIPDTMEFKVTKPMGRGMCEHEVAMGGIVKLENGNYTYLNYAN